MITTFHFSIVTVWQLNQPPDEYAVLEVIDDDSGANDVWASDLLDVKVKHDSRDSVHLFHHDNYIGKQRDLCKLHRLVDLPLVRARPGVACMKVAGSIFSHPSVCGHLWVNTADLFTTLELKGRKRPGVWFQRKKQLLDTLDAQFKLGGPTTLTFLMFLKTHIYHLYNNN